MMAGTRLIYSSISRLPNYRPLYTPEGYAAITPDPPKVLDRLREGPIWVAISGDSVVGTVSLVIKGPQAYIRGMAIAPEARSRGIGALPLHRAIRLYERRGFHRTPNGPPDPHGTPLFSMHKELRRRQGVML